MARVVAGLPLPIAVFAGAVFALLPVQAETVAWITGRVDSLPAAFYIATFLALLRWRKGGSTLALVHGVAGPLLCRAVQQADNHYHGRHAGDV